MEIKNLKEMEKQQKDYILFKKNLVKVIFTFHYRYLTQMNGIKEMQNILIRMQVTI